MQHGHPCLMSTPLRRSVMQLHRASLQFSRRRRPMFILRHHLHLQASPLLHQPMGRHHSHPIARGARRALHRHVRPPVQLHPACPALHACRSGFLLSAPMRRRWRLTLDSCAPSAPLWRRLQVCPCLLSLCRRSQTLARAPGHRCWLLRLSVRARPLSPAAGRRRARRRGGACKVCPP